MNFTLYTFYNTLSSQLHFHSKKVTEVDEQVQYSLKTIILWLCSLLQAFPSHVNVSYVASTLIACLFTGPDIMYLTGGLEANAADSTAPISFQAARQS